MDSPYASSHWNNGTKRKFQVTLTTNGRMQMLWISLNTSTLMENVCIASSTTSHAH